MVATGAAAPQKSLQMEEPETNVFEIPGSANEMRCVRHGVVPGAAPEVALADIKDLVAQEVQNEVEQELA